MTVTLEKPEIITLMYRQEKTDADYGSCMWARFYFDLKNYTLQIESDCGNYIYGWVPTPDGESFMQLCTRFDSGYLLYKLSNQSVIDSANTWQAVKDLVSDIIEIESLDDLDEYDWDQLEAACYGNNDERDVVDSVISALDDTVLRDKYDTYDIWNAIEKDYPTQAKKIVSVFISCIQPFIKKMLEEDK